jgi:long-chain fatty acid transport protein
MYRVNNTRKLAQAVAVAMSLAVPSAYATNGYFAHGYGTKSKAMAGVGAAISQDSLATAANPAGMAFVGDRFDFGMEFFSPRRGYSITGSSNPALNQAQESEFGFFVVPSMGVNFVLPWNDTFGISVYGNGGMNTEYAKAVFGGAYGGSAPAGVDLIQMFVPLTYAHKFNADTSVGIAVIPVYQQFKAYGLTPFGLISSDPSAVSNNGYAGSSGVGYRVGGQMGIASGVTLGVSYQPKINMSPYKKYAGLFAESGDFDIPSTYVVGFAWKATPALTVALDYQRINYTDVKSVSNSAQLPPPVFANTLGTPEGPGFGWADIDIYKLGMQYATGTWAWRLGWNHGENPIEADPVSSNGEVMFNILAPGVVTNHYTFGFTKTLNSTVEINFGGMYAPKVTVTGTNPAIFGGGTTSIHMYQTSVEMSLGVKF